MAAHFPSQACECIARVVSRLLCCPLPVESVQGGTVKSACRSACNRHADLTLPSRTCCALAMICAARVGLRRRNETKRANEVFFLCFVNGNNDLDWVVQNHSTRELVSFGMIDLRRQGHRVMMAGSDCAKAIRGAVRGCADLCTLESLSCCIAACGLSGNVSDCTWRTGRAAKRRSATAASTQGHHGHARCWLSVQCRLVHQACSRGGLVVMQS